MEKESPSSIEYEKAPLERAVLFDATQVCKPGSVLTAIYLVPGSLPGSSRLLGTVGSTFMFLHGVAPDRVYSTPMFPWGGWALTPPFHSYRPCGRRHISVALVLGSPPAGVTCYPCPMKPGLSSRGSFRPRPRLSNPVAEILYPIRSELSNPLANSFGRGYTIINIGLGFKFEFEE